MLRLSKLTDYGTVVLASLARDPGRVHTAADLAADTGLSLPTVSKLLKLLTKGGLLISHRGPHGGYSLARPAERISAVEILDALEGPVAITECSSHHSHCAIERLCIVGHNWRRISAAVREALTTVTLAELARPVPMTPPHVPLASLTRRRAPSQ